MIATHADTVATVGWCEVLSRAAARLPVAVPPTKHELGRSGRSPEAVASRCGVDLIPIPPDGGTPEGVPVISLTETSRPRLLMRAPDDGPVGHVRWAVAPNGAIDPISADLCHEAGEILREWPGSVMVTSKDPRPIVPGSKVWCLKQSTEGA
jgi:hypothetical protein